ncbi:SDR family oxidoreductase [Acuticoccus sp.]|uniref:SDR family oxidoreductase n=1 Tax=Acuticoccus sp. TaxID=1904378 RepID=UPI003B524B2B
MTLPPLSEQVVVLTGATSGIGLATARRLSAAGATLVLVARNDEALTNLEQELSSEGGRAAAMPADVADAEALRRIARDTRERFGRLDTWINDAGVAIYGAIVDVPLDEQRRLFETNYWGVVNGSLAAVEVFRAAGGRGKVINVGSVLSDRAMIFQGPYSASKHAVKGFTDALRMELAEAGLAVSVTLIKPAAIDTPYMEHGRNYLDAAGTKNPPPSYHPDVVAKAIAHACEHDVRDLVVGGGGWAVSLMGALAPTLTDLAMELVGKPMQTSRGTPREGTRDNLESPARDGSERSGMPEPSPRRSSLLLEAQMHPGAVAAATLGLVGTLLLARARRR